MCEIDTAKRQQFHTNRSSFCNLMSTTAMIIIMHYNTNSVYFAIILVYMGYDGQSINSQLPHQTVPMATQQWSMIAFGIISYVIVASTCLMIATNRALSLSSNGALSHKLQVIIILLQHTSEVLLFTT
jgi:hypothetical protein